MWKIKILVLIAAFILGGCMANYLVADFRAAHPECSGDVEAHERGRHTGVFDVSACGAGDVMVRMCAGAGRCRFYAASKAVERASFDLACDAGQLTTQVLDQGQVGVMGCGQRAVYVATRSGWVLNANTMPTGAPGPGANTSVQPVVDPGGAPASSGGEAWP